MDILKKIADWIMGLFSAPPLNFVQSMHNPVNQLYQDTTYQNMVAALIPVGIGLAMIYLLKELLEKTTLKNIDLEQIIKLFIKLVMAFALVTNVFSLFNGMNTFVSTLTNELQYTLNTAEITEAASGIESIIDSIFDAEMQGTLEEVGAPGESEDGNDMGIGFDVFASIIFMLLSFIAQLFFIIIISFVGFSRTIAIGYKTIYAPIAVANIVGYSTRNSAISYCKDMFALFMQYPIAVVGYGVAMKAMGSLSFTTISESTMAPILLLGIAGIWIARSSRTAKEMFG